MESEIVAIDNGGQQGASPYGWELILDLHECVSAKFTRDHIDGYFTELCDLINMQKCEVHFWDDVDVPLEEQQT